MTVQYWLMKTEPNEFSFQDLKENARKTSCWEGVRNYQARNFLLDMKIGDLVLFYHSSCPNPGVMGIAKITRQAYPDSSAFDPNSHYFDPKSTIDSPRWFMVDVTWVKDFKRLVALHELKGHPQLAKMKVVQKGQRLSVQPVTKKEFSIVCELGMGTVLDL